jgi:hypothetical protein
MAVEAGEAKRRLDMDRQLAAQRSLHLKALETAELLRLG